METTEGKVEEFYQVKMGEEDDEPCVETNPEGVAGLMTNNMEMGSSWTIRRIKGIKQIDPTGNFAYTVKEVKD